MSKQLKSLQAIKLSALTSQAELAEDGQQSLWVISYADFLMVLMSFFIIFFEMSDIAEVSPIQALVVSLKENKIVETPALTGQSENRGTASNSASIGGLVQELKKEHISFTTVDMNKGLVIDFPDNVYGAGQYEPTSETKRLLQKVLVLVKPHLDRLSVTFIGHTDATPLKNKHQVVDSNHVLSSLRAAKAVEYAVSLGLDPRGMVGQGVSEYERNSRSLSIRLSEMARK